MRDWTIPTALLSGKAERMADRFVLAIVAGHWNTATRESHPGIRRVAEIAGCSTSTAASHLRRLVETGDLIVDRPGAGTRTTRYRVPALEDGPVAFGPEANTTTSSVRVGANTTEVEGTVDPSSVRFSASSARLARGPGPNESEKSEVEIRARARAREDVELHYATDEERARVAPTIAGIRERFPRREPS